MFLWLVSPWVCSEHRTTPSTEVKYRSPGIQNQDKEAGRCDYRHKDYLEEFQKSTSSCKQKTTDIDDMVKVGIPLIYLVLEEGIRKRLAVCLEDENISASAFLNSAISLRDIFISCQPGRADGVLLY